LSDGATERILINAQVLANPKRAADIPIIAITKPQSGMMSLGFIVTA